LKVIVLPQLLKFIWASPATLIGLTIGVVSLPFGGSMRRRYPTVECWGGLTSRLLERCVPLPGGANAMTLGHVILGRNLAVLDETRSHELIHVAQYERWGPFFLPAYFLASAYVKFKGGQAYLDNPFEREAYLKDGRGLLDLDESNDPNMA
jgi:hypothetical protein